MPAAPPPPGLFTSATGTGTSFSSTMILWITRAIRSAPPPTANGTTNSTSLVGFQPCASAAAGSAASTNSLARKRIEFSSSGERRCCRAHYTRAHGHAGRGRLAGRPARHESHRRGVRPAGKRVPRPGERARGGPLPPLCFEKLSLGAPYAGGARDEGPGEGGAGLLCGTGHVRERLGVHRRRDPLSARTLREGQTRLHRPGDGAGAVGRDRKPHRQQRVVRDHPHAEPRVRRPRAAPARRPLPARTEKGNRLAQRTHLPHGEQRRVPGGLRHRAGQVRGGGERAVPHPRLAGAAHAQAPLAVRARLHRGGRAALHHARALRRGVLLSLQMQPAPAGRLPQPVALDAARVRAAGRGEDGRHGSDQGALLPQHEADQSHADRAKRAVAGLFFGLALLTATPCWATSDLLDGVLAPGEAGVGFTWRFEPSPYRGSDRDADLMPQFRYDSRYFFLHSDRIGLKLENEGARYELFLRRRLEGFATDHVPESMLGMEKRAGGDDLGIALRHRLGAGAVYGEVMRNVSDESEGTELRLGYRYEGGWSGALRWRP